MTNLLTFFAKSVSMVLFICLTGCSSIIAASYHHPGFADFELSDRLQDNHKFNLSLGSFAIGTIRWVIDEPTEVEALLDDLEGVHINTYEVDNNIAAFKEEFSVTQDKLLQAGWHKFAKFSEGNKYTFALMKFEGDVIDGLVVMTLNKEEAIFVNLIGNIQPESFDTIMEQMYENESSNLKE